MDIQFFYGFVFIGKFGALIEYYSEVNKSYCARRITGYEHGLC